MFFCFYSNADPQELPVLTTLFPPRPSSYLDGGAAGRLHRPCGGTQGNRQSLREGTLRRGSSDMSGDLVEAAIAAMAKAYAPYSNFSVGAAVRGAGGGIYSGCNVENARSEEHTSELQSLMRISYAVFCLKTKQTDNMMCMLYYCVCKLLCYF